MGLASSQARLLTLTSRMHSVEYKAQKLEAEKLQLANDSDKAYNTYLTALDATKLQYRVVNNDGSTSFENATFTKLTQAGFLFNVNGVVCYDLEGVKKAMKSEYDIDLSNSLGDSYTLLTTLVQEGYVVIMEKNAEASDAYSYFADTGRLQYDNAVDDNQDWSYGIKNDTDGVRIGDTTFNNGAQGVDVYNELFKVFGDTTPSTSTKLQEVSNEIDLKKAEATYEAEMDKINKKDTRYDTELSQLETERNAIKEEMEALKNVAKENVDRTFKVFT